MGITVRTLQYYDKEGLLSPSTESEGGRRLNTDKGFFDRNRTVISVTGLIRKAV